MPLLCKHAKMHARIFIVGLLGASTAALAAPNACPTPELALGCSSCHGASASALAALPSDAAVLFERLKRLRDAPHAGTVMPRMIGGLDDATLHAIAESVACQQRRHGR